MEKLRVSSVYLHSWRSQEESHARKQGVVNATSYKYWKAWIAIGIQTMFWGAMEQENNYNKIHQNLAQRTSFCLCFPCRKKWSAMTLTSHTGLQISAGQKSAIRKFVLLYFNAIWNGLVFTAILFPSGSVHYKCMRSKHCELHWKNASTECQNVFYLFHL